jgi:hypothetical protein
VGHKEAKMKIKFTCGLCKKEQSLDLADLNHIYLIGARRPGADYPGRLDVNLCPETAEGGVPISDIQAHIKYRDNKWKLYDGVPMEYDETIPYDKKKTPKSFFGTFLRRNKQYILISNETGSELVKDDMIYFVPSRFNNNKSIQLWSRALSGDQLAKWEKEAKTKAKLFDGFKFCGRVIEDKKTALPDLAAGLSDKVKINGENINYCVAIDIVGYTNIIKEEQPIVISEFNSILDGLLSRQKDYISILVGDGIYICLLGVRESHDMHFRLALDFLDKLREVNKYREKKWQVKIALTHGYDMVMTLKIADAQRLNVYGNCINTTARLLAGGPARKSGKGGEEIIVGVTTHQEIHNMEFYKENFKQEPATIVDKHNKEHHCFIYERVK